MHFMWNFSICFNFSRARIRFLMHIRFDTFGVFFLSSVSLCLVARLDTIASRQRIRQLTVTTIKFTVNEIKYTHTFFFDQRKIVNRLMKNRYAYLCLEFSHSLKNT